MSELLSIAVLLAWLALFTSIAKFMSAVSDAVHDQPHERR
jgi:hypothetical protein